MEIEAAGLDPMDEGDVAKRYADLHNAEAIGRVRRQLRAADHAVRLQGPWLCEDCLGEIPRKRIEAVPGATRCRDCQAVYERLKEGM